jgi:hypothetical protein
MADMNLIRHSSFERFLNLGKLVMNTKEENVSKVFKNNDQSVINNKKGNLIPTNYKQFFLVMLSNQDKWNKVFDIFLEKVDELEQKPIIIEEVECK